MKEPSFSYQFSPRLENILVGRSVYGGDVFQVELTQQWRSPAGKEVPGRILDLLDLVQAVFAVDRQSPRQPNSEGYGWGRSLHLALPVRDTGFWRQHRIKDQIEGLLSFLTSDDWHLHWLPHHHIEDPYPLQLPLIDLGEPPAIFTLHSGGLDSLAGACDQLIGANPVRTGLVSVVLADRVAGVQREIYKSLAQRYRGRTFPVEVRLDLRESTEGFGIHRSRSFVFLTIGAVAAHNSGCMTLLQCESGIGSLGLPLLRGALPWQTSRGVHPRFLISMSTFLSRVFDHEFNIVNPYLFRTKAEMCGAIEKAGMTSAIGLSVSCDRFPQRVEDQPQCGKCGPCLLRRQALYSSGLAGYDNCYRYDVTNPRTRIPREGRLQLDAMLCQREKLKTAFAGKNPWRTLTQDYPDLSGTARFMAQASGMESEEARQEICQMLSRYIEEWKRFPVLSSFQDISSTHDRRRVRNETPRKEEQLQLLDIGPR